MRCMEGFPIDALNDGVRIVVRPVNHIHIFQLFHIEATLQRFVSSIGGSPVSVARRRNGWVIVAHTQASLLVKVSKKVGPRASRLLDQSDVEAKK